MFDHSKLTPANVPRGLVYHTRRMWENRLQSHTALSDTQIAQALIDSQDVFLSRDEAPAGTQRTIARLQELEADAART